MKRPQQARYHALGVRRDERYRNRRKGHVDGHPQGALRREVYRLPPYQGHAGGGDHHQKVGDLHRRRGYGPRKEAAHRGGARPQGRREGRQQDRHDGHREGQAEGRGVRQNVVHAHERLRLALDPVHFVDEVAQALQRRGGAPSRFQDLGEEEEDGVGERGPQPYADLPHAQPQVQVPDHGPDVRVEEPVVPVLLGYLRQRLLHVVAHLHVFRQVPHELGEGALDHPYLLELQRNGQAVEGGRAYHAGGQGYPRLVEGEGDQAGQPPGYYGPLPVPRDFVPRLRLRRRDGHQRRRYEGRDDDYRQQAHHGGHRRGHDEHRREDEDGQDEEEGDHHLADV